MGTSLTERQWFTPVISLNLLALYLCPYHRLSLYLCDCRSAIHANQITLQLGCYYFIAVDMVGMLLAAIL